MAPVKSLMIKNLVPGLTERGKIKIGQKGEWRDKRGGGKFQLPQKLDHFLITTMQRGEDNNYLKDNDLMEAIAGEGVPLTRIPIRLLYNDIELNFQTRYSCYRGTQVLCYGDGAEAWALRKEGQREKVGCPCKYQDPKWAGNDKCKINGTLSCIIDGAEIVGGVWKFRTTSFNSVVGIISSLTLIRRISGGYLAGLPLDLTIAPKTVSNPISGKAQTVFVVNVEFMGSVQALRDEGFKYALEDKKHEFRIENLEAEAKRLLSPDAAGFQDVAEDIVDEFSPQDDKGNRLGEPTGTPDLAKPSAEGPGPQPEAEGPDDLPGKRVEKPAPATPPKQGRRGRPRSKPENKPEETPKMDKPAAGPEPGPDPADTQDQAQGAQDAPTNTQGPAKSTQDPGKNTQDQKSGKLSLF